MDAQTELVALRRFLDTLTRAELVTFNDQFHSLVCERLATVPEIEHLAGHAYAEWLSGERRDEPSTTALSDDAAARMRSAVTELAFALQLAFVAPVHARGVAGVCETVIVRARRGGHVHQG